ncbi:response regulator [Mariprofundus erugo]|nr:response regulator [Mariprofundus erugo]
MNEMTSANEKIIRRGMRWKLMAGVIITIVAMVTLLTILQLSSYKNSMNNALETHINFLKEEMSRKADKSAENLSGHVQTLIATNRLSLVRDFIRDAVQDIDDLKYVVLMKGNEAKVAFGSNLEPAMREALTDGDISSFAASQRNKMTREFVYGGHRFLETIIPIRIQGEHWGVLRLGFSLDLLNRRLLQSQEYINTETAHVVVQATVTAAIFLILGTFAVYFLARRWTDPIRKLVQFSHELARGNFDAKPHISMRSDDEIGMLVASIEEMAASLSSSYEKLANHGHELESEVEKRTHQLAEARDRALAATRAKSDFLANMSHEIRTPMNAVIGLSHLALGHAEGRQQQDYLNKILAASKALLIIINDILDFSKIEAGKMSMETVEFDLDETLKHVAGVGGIEAARKGLDFLFDVPPGLPMLRGDPVRLGQVLLNLVNNALKFTSRGEVVVTIQVLESSDADALLSFSIRDTGIGMVAEQLVGIFDAFSQADTSTTRKFGGTGLGLAICKQLVGMMGGEIGVESTPGEGSCFHFTARLALSRPIRTESACIEPHKSVYIVDAGRHSGDILQRMLTGAGFTSQWFTTVGDAQAALQDENVRQPDLLLVDWQLPDANTETAIRRLRQAAGESLPVVLIQPIGHEEKMQYQGVDVRLFKPVICSELLDGIERALKPDAVASAVDQRTVASMHRLNGVRLLLAEDNEINREVAEGLLLRAGVSLQVVHDGQQLLEAVEHDDFDAILLDLQMPVMGGLEVTRILRSQARFDAVPIIAMTANAMAEDRQRCLQAGMNDHLAKPIHPDKLYDTLVRWIDDSRLSAAAIVPEPLVEDVALPSMPEIDGLDVRDGLMRIGGDPLRYASVLESFLGSHADAMAKLGQLADAGDLEGVRTRLHLLKGVCGNIGATALHQQLELLEAEVDREDCLPPAEMKALADSFAVLLASIGQWHAGRRDVIKEHGLMEAKPLIEQMRLLLNEYNGDAVDMLAGLSDALAGSEAGRLYPQLRQQLSAYDFDAALATLDRIEALCGQEQAI